jgi:hypothetical protein
MELNPNQLLLNRLVPRLREQGVKSVDPNAGSCRYRLNDLCCLIGQGIDDDHYILDLEAEELDLVFEAVLASNPDIGCAPGAIDLDFWNEAQKAHDRSDQDLEGFEAALTLACHKYGYEVPNLTKEDTMQPRDD